MERRLRTAPLVALALGVAAVGLARAGTGADGVGAGFERARARLERMREGRANTGSTGTEEQTWRRGQQWFLRGARANRRGDSREALRAFVQSARLGYHHPDHAFELGWAHLNAGRLDTASSWLEVHETLFPGRAATAELLGRCRLRQGSYQEAEEWLRKAIERDPTRRATAGVFLARAAAARGDRKAATQELGEVLTEAPDTPVGRLLRRVIGAPVRPRKATAGRWRGRLQLGLGYDSNVIAQSDGLPLPTNISGKDSVLRQVTGQLGRTWREPRGATWANLVLHRDDYVVIPSSDLDVARLSAGHLRRLDDRFSVTWSAGAGLATIGGRSFRRGWNLRIALRYRQGPRRTWELSHAFERFNYLFASQPSTDRDGHTNTYGLAHEWVPGEGRTRLRLGLTSRRNSTVGSDFRFDSQGLDLAWHTRLAGPWELDVTALWAEDDYDAPSTVVLGPGAREDERLATGVRIGRDLRQDLELFLRLDHRINDSNVPFYEYDQTVSLVGVSHRF